MKRFPSPLPSSIPTLPYQSSNSINIIPLLPPLASEFLQPEEKLHFSPPASFFVFVSVGRVRVCGYGAAVGGRLVLRLGCCRCGGGGGIWYGEGTISSLLGIPFVPYYCSFQSSFRAWRRRIRPDLRLYLWLNLRFKS